MKILKFGGSSVANAERISQVLNILKKERDHFAVVFSAFGGVTDQLIKMSNIASDGDSKYEEIFEDYCKRHLEIAESLLSGDLLNEVNKELHKNFRDLRNILEGIKLLLEATPRTMDYVLSFGERNSAFVISRAMRNIGLDAEYLDARTIIKTNRDFGSARVNFSKTNENIQEHFKIHSSIQVITGFIAAHTGGLTTTLGRGGSDYSAAILGAALNADSIEIWTDVNGILTSDPRKVKKAFTIPSVSYEEAMEMSHFGAKVIYPPTIQPALKAKIPVYIKNTFNPDFNGSLISNAKGNNKNPVKGISSISGVSLLSLQGSGMFGVPGIAARLFSSLAKEKINIILITQGSSEHSISFAIQPQDVQKAIKSIEKEFEYEIKSGNIERVKKEENLSVIAIIGEYMRYTPGIAGRLFRSLGQNGINVIAIAQGSSELNISVVIKKDDEKKALNTLHESFFLSDTKSVHLFIAGVGLIGSTLLDQIKQQSKKLIKENNLEFKVAGIANSKHFIVDEEGIDLDHWKELLKEGTPYSSDAFAKRMVELNLRNSIFVDNTASAAVADQYKYILSNSISVSTPNKIAASSSFSNYEELKRLAYRRGVKFRYETNVGAGLPVINTLRDLINSGDQVHKIEGVLSGSLSFIFNRFNSSMDFSHIVKEAKSLGYTEPDPRDDLNGSDVKRKIIILARECGAELEMEDVNIEYILPEACRNAETVDQFFQELSNHNTHFANLIVKAEKESKKLRFVARYENNEISIQLEAVAAEHPFYALKGTENMIIFTTDRYKELPLVVRGPGAGARVTAAGVFAEIISISNSFS